MNNDLQYDRTRPLYISPGKRFSLDNTKQALELAYAKAQPVVIYIHGRAKDVGEPLKSEKTGIYRELADYGISPIGFTWDADDGGYDDSRAEASAEDFDTFIDVLGKYITAEKLAKPSLLAHSMGNIILAELAQENRLSAERGKLFTNVILNAAAIKSKRHHKWLRKIGTGERVYVMVNPDDIVLNFAGILWRPNMLGQEIKKPGVTEPHVYYVNLGKLGVNHRYFVKSRQNGSSNLNHFFSDVLQSKEAVMDTYAEVIEKEKLKVYSMKPDE